MTTDIFSSDLDVRIERVLKRQNIKNPTLIQEKVLPLAFSGKDILGRARTGSGKTLAYLLPILQGLITEHQQNITQGRVYDACIRAIIMVPTRELARQVASTCLELMHYFPREISILDLCGEDSLQAQRTKLCGSSPSILISTPTRIIPHVEGGLAAVADLRSMRYLVVDEADLLLSFGYCADIEKLSRDHIPRTVQTFLLSATLTEEVERLRQLILRNPVSVSVEDGVDPAADESTGAPKLSQYVLRCEADDRFLVIYVALKLRLLKGKLLIFANDVECCVRLKLFLDQFGIRSCVLNPELPIVSRHHIVDEFNRGVYDILLASDLLLPTYAGDERRSTDSDLTDPIKSMKSTSNPEHEDSKLSVEEKLSVTKVEEEDYLNTSKDLAEKRGVREKKGGIKWKRNHSKEYGVSRGLDFKRVDFVINFDTPLRVDSYVHRVGRTARGGAGGTAITFVSSEPDERIIAAIEKDQVTRGYTIEPHDFDLGKIEGFRYRCRDALRAVTRGAIRKARLQSVRDELVKSERLKTFFADRPGDLAILRHDQSLLGGIIKPAEHLKNVPDYLLPSNAILMDSKMQSMVVPGTSSVPSAPRRIFKVRPSRSSRGGSNVLRGIKRR